MSIRSIVFFTDRADFIKVPGYQTINLRQAYDTPMLSSMGSIRVIVVDITIFGDSLIHNIRRIGISAPLILLGGHGQHCCLDRFSELDIYGCLHRPLVYTELIQLINECDTAYTNLRNTINNTTKRIQCLISEKQLIHT